MKIPKDLTNTGAALLATLFTLTNVTPVFAEDAAPPKAQVLLDQVKKSELDREQKQKLARKLQTRGFRIDVVSKLLF